MKGPYRKNRKERLARRHRQNARKRERNQPKATSWQPNRTAITAIRFAVMIATLLGSLVMRSAGGLLGDVGSITLVFVGLYFVANVITVIVHFLGWNQLGSALDRGTEKGQK